MLLIDNPGTGRSISRYQAVDISKFTEACEYGFIRDTDGDIQYGITVMIDGQLHGCAFVVPGEKAYNQNRIHAGIVQLYGELAKDGLIGPESVVKRDTVTLTGNPFNDLLQVGLAVTAPPSEDEARALVELDAMKGVREVAQ